jgi:hypothetical protein
MADGIRINDASLEISPGGLEAMMRREGAEVKITRLDLTVSPEALATLLSRMAPEGEPPPTAQVEEGRLLVTRQQEGKRTVIDLEVGGFRLELTPGGLRLVGGRGGESNTP